MPQAGKGRDRRMLPVYCATCCWKSIRLPLDIERGNGKAADRPCPQCGGAVEFGFAAPTEQGRKRRATAAKKRIALDPAVRLCRREKAKRAKAWERNMAQWRALLDDLDPMALKRREAGRRGRAAYQAQLDRRTA